MRKTVRDYIPETVLGNPYYKDKQISKYLSHNVLSVYDASTHNTQKYPFTLFTQKYITRILEIAGKFIAINQNPRIGWTFHLHASVAYSSTQQMYMINDEPAIYIKYHEDSLVFLFLSTKRQRSIPSKILLELKKEGKYRECTAIEKLDLLFNI